MMTALLSLMLVAPVGFLAYVTDHTAFGCAYDPAAPTAVTQVHVYAEGTGNPIPSIGVAQYACPWSADPAYTGHGFWIPYRRPVSDLGAVQVAAISTTGGSALWLSRTGTIEVNDLGPLSSFRTANYRAEVAPGAGAILVGFYNRHHDQTVNLVNPDPGSAVQAALFGPRDTYAGAPCQPIPDRRWNPTQSGARCTPSVTDWFVASEVSECQSSTATWCASGAKILGATGGWIRWRVRFRNFNLPLATGPMFPYQTFEDTSAWVTYTFNADHLQVDYLVTRVGAESWGVSFQQLPVAFLAQVTKLEWHNEPAHVIHAVSEAGRVEVLDPGNEVTAAFYLAPVADRPLDSVGPTPIECPVRDCAMGTGMLSEQPGIGSAVQCSPTFEPKAGRMYQSRLLLLPGPPDPRLDVLDSEGGLRPAWDCQ